MTEEEAKTKVCCGPLHADHGALVLCQGSACMAWREMETGSWTRTFREWMDAEQWIEAVKTHRNHTGSTLKDAKDFVDSVRAGNRPMPTPEPAGFCGLAGKP